MSPLEVAAVVFSLACVWLSVVQHVATWPTSIVAVLAYFVVFWRTRLYADAALQLVFCVQSAYGWYYWTRHGDRAAAAPVRRLTTGAALGWGAAMLAAVLVVWQGLARLTDAASPLWDATVSVLSLTANWLLARKVLENWAIWLVADVLYVALFWSKGLRLSAALYVVFLVLAAQGLARWTRDWRAQGAAA